MSVTAIIPARYASTRFPGKPLASETGKPLIQHVYEAVARARRVDRVLVATDDERIAAAVRRFGGEATMTRPDHASGTDRVAEAAAGLAAELIVNVQGDEPEMEPAAVDTLVACLQHLSLVLTIKVRGHLLTHLAVEEGIVIADQLWMLRLPDHIQVQLRHLGMIEYDPVFRN